MTFVSIQFGESVLGSSQDMTVVGRIMGSPTPQKCPCPHPCSLQIGSPMRQRKIKVADRIEAANRMTLKYGDDPRFPGWPGVITSRRESRDVIVEERQEGTASWPVLRQPYFLAQPL